MILYRQRLVQRCSRGPRPGASGFFPVSPAFAPGYTAIFKNKFLISGFANSIFYTGVGTLIDVALTLLAAIRFSRPICRPPLITFLFFFTTLFSGGLIQAIPGGLRNLNARYALGHVAAGRAVGVESDHRTYFQITIRANYSKPRSRRSRRFHLPAQNRAAAFSRFWH